MTFAPRTWVVGEVVSAAIMNQEVRDQFNSMFGAWTAYTPAWTASTNPVLGSGTLTGRYMKIGRTVAVEINLIAAANTTFGSGAWNFSLPATSANTGITKVGTAHLLGTDRWAGQIVLSPNNSTAACFFPISATNTRINFASATVPETANASTQLRLFLVYEAAS
ncbi:hypothetical protein AB0P02_06930 [Streptomyces griseoluteus]|uniref:hypothetical protein n=1 Tax=Streptomyces griseoluteus TaxID=29306 RepID=UPI0034443944